MTIPKMDPKTEAAYLEHFQPLVSDHPETYTKSRLIDGIKIYGFTHFGKVLEPEEASALVDKLLGEGII